MIGKQKHSNTKKGLYNSNLKLHEQLTAKRSNKVGWIQNSQMLFRLSMMNFPNKLNMVKYQ